MSILPAIESRKCQAPHSAMFPLSSDLGRLSFFRAPPCRPGSRRSSPSSPQILMPASPHNPHIPPHPLPVHRRGI
eukprot:755494-Hanusia_phi.AAC.5